MSTKVIIAAGGLGTRLKTIHPKPLVMLNGKPLLAYSLEIFEKSPFIDGIIIAVHEYHILDVEDVVKHYNIQKVERVTIGGASRALSVYNGLQEIGGADFVAIHDGARPFLKGQTLQKVIEQAKTSGGAILGVPIKPTIKKVNSDLIVQETLNRSELWEIQTPQVFSTEILLKAYAQDNINDATDDSTLVERLGIDVKVVEGDYENVKITTNEDLAWAESLLAGNNENALK